MSQADLVFLFPGRNSLACGGDLCRLCQHPGMQGLGRAPSRPPAHASLGIIRKGGKSVPFPEDSDSLSCLPGERRRLGMVICV